MCGRAVTSKQEQWTYCGHTATQRDTAQQLGVHSIGGFARSQNMCRSPTAVARWANAVDARLA